MDNNSVELAEHELDELALGCAGGAGSAYKSVDEADLLTDILSRKEFAQLDGPTNNQGESIHLHMQLHRHQEFVRAFINPNTPYRRLLLKHKPGTGKTLSAQAIAEGFIDVYKRMYDAVLTKHGRNKASFELAEVSTPTVFVIGFTQTNYIRDLLKYPALGYISVPERAELDRAMEQAHLGGAVETKRYTEMYARFKRRITHKAQGGFYRFYGYQEFVNRLFVDTGGVNLMALESDILAKRTAGTQTDTLEGTIAKLVETGTIKVNHGLIKRFKNSLIICDEVHNTYNSFMKNNYGVALQFMLDHMDGRAIFLTATPINNSPTEIVDVINYLLSAGERVTTDDLFVAGSKALKPGALERIRALCSGRVSFLQDNDRRYYPTVTMAGSPRPSIDYLKFELCVMSKLHEATYKNYLNETNQTHTIPIDGAALMDLVFPSAGGFGIFRSADIRTELQNGTAEELARLNVTVSNRSIGGGWLARGNVAKYSTKLARLLELIDATFKLPPNKSMIYHSKVTTSGVLLYQELLRANGIIDEQADPTECTRCSVCGVAMSKHKGANHEFYPARFVIVHGSIDKRTMDASIVKFNSVNNATGVKYRFLIGSSVIKESYDIKAVRHFYIMNHPQHIPELIQIIGRCSRKGSHSALPTADWTVILHLFLSVFSDSGRTTAEEQRYYDKIQDYKTVQYIEREMNKDAIDAVVLRDIIAPDTKDALGDLWFEPSVQMPVGQAEQTTTFNAYGHGSAEVAKIIHIIKRLFMRRPVWTYEELLSSVRDPGFVTMTSTHHIDENNFAVALTMMSTATIGTDQKQTTANYTQDVLDRMAAASLFDINDRFVQMDTKRYKIEQTGRFYVRFPIEDNVVVKDIDSFAHSAKPTANITIDLASWIKRTKLDHNYALKREQFKAKYAFATDIASMLGEYTPGFYNRLFKDIIAWYVKKPPIDQAVEQLYHKVIELFRSLNIIVFASDLRSRKALLQKFKKPPATRIGSTPIGFVDATGVNLFDAPNWITVGKDMLDIRTQYRDNNTIVGYFDLMSTGVIKFKLRTPEHKIVKAADQRGNERGMACDTRPKKQLMHIAQQLKVPAASEHKHMRIQDLCTRIMRRMLQLEIAERRKNSSTKYIYLWPDEMKF